MPLVARDLMTRPNVRPVGTSLRDVAVEIIERRYSGVIFVDADGRLAGIVEVQDILPRPSTVPFSNVPVLVFQDEWVDGEGIDAYQHAMLTTPVEQVMRTNPARARPDDHISRVLELLVLKGNRRVVVVDDDQRPIGVITNTDILRVLSDHHPEGSGAD